MKTKIAILAAALAAATVTATACSSSSDSGGSSDGPTGLGLSAPPAGGTGQASSGDAGQPAAQGDAGPGVSADSLTCDKFPLADLQSAAQQVVTTAEVQLSQSAISAGGSCLFTVFTPGTDTRGSNSGGLGVVLTIHDSNGSGTGKLDDERSSFDSLKGIIPPDGNGTTTKQSDASGLGVEAYVRDKTNKGTTDEVIQYQDELYVLREARPYSVFLSTDYEIPNSGAPLPDKSLDQAMRDAGQRAAMIQALGKAVLAAIG